MRPLSPHLTTGFCAIANQSAAQAFKRPETLTIPKACLEQPVAVKGTQNVVAVGLSSHQDLTGGQQLEPSKVKLRKASYRVMAKMRL